MPVLIVPHLEQIPYFVSLEIIDTLGVFSFKKYLQNEWNKTFYLFQ